GEATASAISQISKGRLAIGTADGKLFLCEVKFETSFDQGGRRIEPEIDFTQPSDSPAGGPIRFLAFRDTKDGPLMAASIAPREVVVQRFIEQKALIGESTFSQTTSRLVLPVSGEISALTADDRGEDLFAGTTDGQLVRVDLTAAEPASIEAVQVG